MAVHRVAALRGRVLARKGEASPISALRRLVGPVAAAWNDVVNPIADPASPGHNCSGLGLLIRRRSTIIPGAAAVRARKGKRRQLTVRLPLDRFRRFKELAGRSGRTYQNVLETATQAYLEQTVPLR